MRENGVWSLNYAYVVDARRYENDVYQAFGSDGGAEWASDMARRYPVGARVSVNYDKANPENAMLNKSIDGSYVIGLMIIAFITLFVLGFWIAFFDVLMEDKRNIEPHGVPLDTDGSGALRAQLPHISPWRAAYLAALGALILGWVIASAMGGPRPSIDFALIGWAAVLGLIALAPVWILLRRAGGHYDLVVKPDEVIVPPVAGRQTPLCLARAEIVGVTGFERPQPGRGGGTFYGVSLKTKAGTNHAVAEWRADDERATRFSKWLAAELRVPVESRVGLLHEFTP